MKNIYLKLLKEYSDSLIALQDKGRDLAFRGGMYCRSCKMIHGRCPDAVYGLILMYKLTKKEKYLKACKEVFDYGYNMECPDGALYNDAQAEWRCTTVFHLTAVIEALECGKEFLGEEYTKKFEERALRMAEWLYINLDESNPAHINYAATNGLALALAGKYFGIEKYSTRGKRLAEYGMKHFTENSLLFGESTPHDARSDKNCLGIDLGYQVEESVPSLVKFAYLTNDEEMKDKLEKILEDNLIFMFPDGGWDNTFGNRNYKWTYWGSRTSDGCAPGYLLMADRNPMFAEAVYRNAMLMDRCSNGLLFGGPDYEKHGEYACSHHAFERMTALAFVVEKIDPKYFNPKHVKLPMDKTDYFKYYEEMRSYKFKRGAYNVSFTDYDFRMIHANHATGGTLTALYGKNAGPMIMASTNLYVLTEPTNQQQVLDRDHHRSLTPRIELNRNGVTYYSCYYTKAEISEKHTRDYVSIDVKGGMMDRWLGLLEGVNPNMNYTLTKNGMNIKINNLNEGKFILPLINGNCNLVKGNLVMTDDIFYLIGGFCAKEYTITPNQNGEIELMITE